VINLESKAQREAALNLKSGIFSIFTALLKSWSYLLAAGFIKLLYWDINE